MKYSHNIRTAIIRCIETYVGNSNSALKVDLKAKKRGGITQFHQELVPMCTEAFEKMLETQDLFMQRAPPKEGEEVGRPYFMDLVEMIRDPDLREDVTKELGSKVPGTSVDFWTLVKSVFQQKLKTLRAKAPKSELKWEGELMRVSKIPMLIEANLMEIVFAYTFPRVDIEVTKGVNHLLKAPFCIHPKTGKICTPIRPSKAHEFGPSVATLGTLHSELESGGPGASMQEAIQIFDEEFLGPLQRRLKAKRERKVWRERINMVNGPVDVEIDYSKQTPAGGPATTAS